LVSWHDYELTSKSLAAQQLDEVLVTPWQLSLGKEWTLPCVELTPTDAKGTTILVADAGRASAAQPIGELLAKGQRVLAVDPFYLGESRISQRDFLFALLVSSVGERPLGIQASQLAALARWAQASHRQPVQIVAIGPRIGLAALVMQAVAPGLVEAADIREGVSSLKQVIDNNWSVDTHPELFCFGLLEHADIEQIRERISAR